MSGIQVNMTAIFSPRALIANPAVLRAALFRAPGCWSRGTYKAWVFWTWFIVLIRESKLRHPLLNIMCRQTIVCLLLMPSGLAWESDPPDHEELHHLSGHSFRGHQELYRPELRCLRWSCLPGTSLTARLTFNLCRRSTRSLRRLFKASIQPVILEFRNCADK